MSSNNKKPGIAFWSTVAAAVLVILYPLSIGPLIWLADRGMLPEEAAGLIGIIYYPLELAAASSDATIRLYSWYASLWMRPGHTSF